MKIRITSIYTIWICMLLSVMATSTTAETRKEREAKFKSRVVPLLRTFCFDCHSGDKPEGDLSLDGANSAREILEGRKHWLKALKQLRVGAMPPKDADPLSKQDRQFLSDWLDGTLNDIDCTGTPDAGRVTMRRLNRVEYRNTIRDLVGHDYQPAADFPGDDVGYGFDNIGDVLSLPPLLMEKYLAAAAEITNHVIVANTSPLIKRITAKQMLATNTASDIGGDARLIASSGKLVAQFDFPESGTYRLVVHACGDQAGDEDVEMGIELDSKLTQTIKVSQPRNKPHSFEKEGRIEKGKHSIGVSFLNDYYKPNVADRNLAVHWIEIHGPLGSQKNLPDSHRKLIFVTPDEKVSPEKATKEVLTRFANRAFRRPLSNDEVSRLERIAKMVRDDGGTYEEGIQLAMQAVMTSPFFLFRVEADPIGNFARPLNDYEIASRLSYFLWSSMPDAELFKHAWNGTLRKDDNLKRQVQRMLKDKKAEALVDNFALQWLQLRHLGEMTPDAKLFPSYNEQLQKDMLTETRMFLAEIIQQDLPLTNIIDGEFTFLNQRLAKHYEIPNVQGDQFRKVSLKNTPRGGVLTHGSVLTITSNPTRTSPVKRGKWVLDNLLGEPPPPPAADVPQLDDQTELTGTLRQKLEQHRASPICASCHKRMDPLGFAFENFDAIGAFRTRDENLPIDASGELPSGEKFNGAKELRKLLATSSRKQFLKCVSEKMLTYALGRGLEYYDVCAVDNITKSIDANDGTFSSLVIAVVNSRPFQWRGPQKGK
jgi:hypothetical protein